MRKWTLSFLMLLFLAGVGLGVQGCASGPGTGVESTSDQVVEKPRREGSGYQ